MKWLWCAWPDGDGFRPVEILVGRGQGLEARRWIGGFGNPKPWGQKAGGGWVGRAAVKVLGLSGWEATKRHTINTIYDNLEITTMKSSINLAELIEA